MIFLSAQPDTSYFIWQLEIQIENFSSFGISANKFHILVAYDKEKGINPSFLDFSKSHNSKATFFFYPDNRKEYVYISTIRPHIIHQHFIENDWLCSEIIFYHDSDILFTSGLPDFDRLCTDEYWYFSNARYYIGVDHIKSRGSDLLRKMCEIINIDPKIVIKNDENAGGAQAILKYVDAAFWKNLEIDCLNLFLFLEKCNPVYKKRFQRLQLDKRKKYHPISSWYADMWALLWNAFKIAKVKVDKQLDFSWPYNDIADWEKMYIFHNAGVTHYEADRMFFKSHYIDFAPYDKNLDFVPENLCGHKYAKLVMKFGEHKVYNCIDTTFLIAVRIDSSDRLENLEAVLKYLNKKFTCRIKVLEADKYRKVSQKRLPNNVEYKFVQDRDEVFYREKYINELANWADTPVLIRYDCDVVIPASQLIVAIWRIRQNDSDVCYPYDGSFMNVIGAVRSNFIKMQNVQTLDKYIKSDPVLIPSYGGCAVLSKKSYIELGLENTNFKGWGFEDQEFNKRARILGYKVSRTPGPLFHLYHKRGKNSFFANDKELLNSYNEYIKVCNMKRTELLAYVGTEPKYEKQKNG